MSLKPICFMVTTDGAAPFHLETTLENLERSVEMLERERHRKAGALAALLVELRRLAHGTVVALAGRRIVLPYDRARFRETSVVDRSGHWGERYDRALDQVASAGDLIEDEFDPNAAETYYEANRRILEEAAELARASKRELLSVIVWDNESRGLEDVTDDFRRRAEALEFAVEAIRTR